MKIINYILCIIFSILVIVQSFFAVNWNHTVKTSIKIIFFTTYIILILPDIYKYMQRKIKGRRIRLLCIKAKQLFDNKEYEKELKILNKLIKINSISQNYSLRGSIYSKLHRYKEAIADITYAIQLSPTEYRLYESRAFCYEHIHHIEQAISDYLKALQLKPEDESLILFLAHAYSDNKEYEKSIFYYDKVLNINKYEIEAYIGKGICYNRLYKYNEAIQTYKSGLEIDSNAVELYVNIGIAYSNMKMFDISSDYYAKAIEMDKNNFYSYYNRGILFYAQKYYQEAIIDFTKSIELDKCSIEAYLWISKAYRMLGNTNKAQENIKKAKELRSQAFKKSNNTLK